MLGGQVRRGLIRGGEFAFRTGRQTDSWGGGRLWQWTLALWAGAGAMAAPEAAALHVGDRETLEGRTRAPSYQSVTAEEVLMANSACDGEQRRHRKFSERRGSRREGYLLPLVNVSTKL